MNKNSTWFFSVFFGILLASAAEGQGWTRFRGPNGQGISDATTIPIKWTQSDFNWKATLPGGGHGSPVVWKDKVFLTCEDPNSPGGMLLTLGVSDGHTLWSRRYKLTDYRHHNDNCLAVSTPAVDAQRVYVLWQTSSEVILAALDHDGRPVWQRDFPGIYSRFGPGTSPALLGDIVVFSHEHWAEGPEGGKHQSSWIALDCKTGRTRWTTSRNSAEISYSTPCVYAPDGREPQLIFTSWAHGVTGVEPQTGRVTWEAQSVLPARVVSSPVLADDMIIGTCGKGAAGLQLSAVRPGSADDPASAGLVYKCIGKSAPYVPTPLAKDGLLFTFHDQGDVSCLNIKDGQVLWSQKPGGKFYGSPVWVNGLLYCINRAGEVLVIRAAATYELLAINPLGEASQATPAVADGKMYLRTWSGLISIGGPSRPVAERRQ
ncbi:MAG TPA: PQQ-binding-like beta-propeller repeat protein [Sedimentisphaerales bacterium]|nr:PQQ-binding-like beta-propeller repeat protein [Sedimentisphaerales bacterium]